MAYAILLAPPAERQLKAFAASIQKRIVKRLKSLHHDPRPQGVKKLAGEDALYPIREGSYRILYTIQDKQLVVLVVKIGDRKEVYRWAAP
jgi:mRNA interferase RelE/StbE